MSPSSAEAQVTKALPFGVSVCLSAITSGFGDAFGCTSMHMNVCAFLCAFRIRGFPLSETQAESSWEICTQATGTLEKAWGGNE